jgi:hypothetical protein
MGGKRRRVWRLGAGVAATAHSLKAVPLKPGAAA